MAVRYLDEHEERCKFCKGDCEIEGMSGSIICHGFVAKTNADRIRSMTDEELAKFVTMVHGNGLLGTGPTNGWLDWLRQEASDG